MKSLKDHFKSIWEQEKNTPLSYYHSAGKHDRGPLFFT